MKILHVINSLNTGGAEKLLIESIPIYVSEGIEIDVLLLNGRETPFLRKLAQEKGFNIITLGDYSVYNPILIFKIIPIIKKYDIVHGHLFPTLYWLSLANKISVKKAKLVYTEHSTTNKRRTAYVISFIDRLFYKSYDKIITISKDVDLSLRKHLKKNFSKMKLIKNGIDLEKIFKAVATNRVDLSLESNVKLIIQVSSFRYPKDQMTIIRALNILPTNYVAILVGEGELKAECERQVESLGLSNRVIFLGVRMDVPNLLKASDYVVLSSAYEGLSLSSVEGLASGRPFLATSVPGLKDVVEGAGVLFSFGDHEQLAREVLKLESDESLRNRTISKCISRSQEYDIREMVKLTIHLYKTLLN